MLFPGPGYAGDNYRGIESFIWWDLSSVKKVPQAGYSGPKSESDFSKCIKCEVREVSFLGAVETGL